MILSHETAMRLDNAFFDVLMSGILPPTMGDYASHEYVAKMAVYYDIRKRRIKSSLGCPLFVDVSDIIRDLERVPKRTLSDGDEVSVLLSGINLNSDKKVYCVYTKWEFQGNKLALILMEESKFEALTGITITPDMSGFTYWIGILEDIFSQKNSKGDAE